jgi:hypothetical protein
MPHQEWRDAQGRVLPSVTEVLDVSDVLESPEDSLAQWRGRLGNREADRLMNEAAELGTQMHSLVDEAFDRGEVVEAEDDSLPHQLAARAFEWATAHSVIPIAREQGILNAAEGYGGTSDLIHTMDGAPRLLVCDWKSSGCIRVTYRLQLSAYARAWNLAHGLTWETGINAGCIVRPQKKFPLKPAEWRMYENLEADYEVFRGLLKAWNFINRRGQWEGEK